MFSFEHRLFVNAPSALPYDRDSVCNAMGTEIMFARSISFLVTVAALELFALPPVLAQDTFSSIHSKIGNDGSVTCDIYCNGKYKKYDKNDPYRGSCIAAHINDAAKTPYTCYGVPHRPVACLCATFD